MKNVETAYAVTANCDYGENRSRGAKLIGVAITHDTAVTVMEKAFETAKNAFLDHICKNGHTSDECIINKHENSRSIRLHTPDEIAPDFEHVTVCIETTMLYSDWNRPAHCIIGCKWKHDKVTDITFMTGKCDLTANGFEPTGKLKNMQNKWIIFWKNTNTEEVAMSLDKSDVPIRIFQDKDDGNRWFKTYVRPMHGSKIVPIETPQS